MANVSALLLCLLVLAACSGSSAAKQPYIDALLNETDEVVVNVDSDICQAKAMVSAIPLERLETVTPEEFVELAYLADLGLTDSEVDATVAGISDCLDLVEIITRGGVSQALAEECAPLLGNDGANQIIRASILGELLPFETTDPFVECVAGQ